METEFEAKFYPVDKEEIRKKLKKIGAKLVTPERKMRRVISDIATYPQLKCHYLRVRDEGDGVVRMSAKLHTHEKGKVSDTKEIEFEVSDFDKAVELLELAGLKPSRYQETLRETWEYDGVEITIDTWPGLEPLLEIEGKSTAAVRKVANRLGFDWGRKIVTAVPEIYAKAHGLPIEEVLEKISNLTFENNPFGK